MIPVFEGPQLRVGPPGIEHSNKKTKLLFLRYDKMKLFYHIGEIGLFSAIWPYILVGKYKRSGGNCYFILPSWRRRQQVPPKLWHISIGLPGITPQRPVIIICSNMERNRHQNNWLCINWLRLRSIWYVTSKCKINLCY